MSFPIFSYNFLNRTKLIILKRDDEILTANDDEKFNPIEKWTIEVKRYFGHENYRTTMKIFE
jgi:hypothetical protein